MKDLYRSCPHRLARGPLRTHTQIIIKFVISHGARLDTDSDVGQKMDADIESDTEPDTGSIPAGGSTAARAGPGPGPGRVTKTPAARDIRATAKPGGPGRVPLAPRRRRAAGSISLPVIVYIRSMPV